MIQLGILSALKWKDYTPFSHSVCIIFHHTELRIASSASATHFMPRNACFFCFFFNIQMLKPSLFLFAVCFKEKYYMEKVKHYWWTSLYNCDVISIYIQSSIITYLGTYSLVWMLYEIIKVQVLDMNMSSYCLSCLITLYKSVGYVYWQSHMMLYNAEVKKLPKCTGTIFE